MKLALYCQCGAAWVADMPGDPKPMLQAWNDEHQGPGHGKATAEEARRARAKAEAKSAHED